MRRLYKNWHDRAVGTFFFVVVFLAATLIGTPHNRDGKIGLSRKPNYSRTILLPGRRTLTKNEVTTNTVDEHVAEEQKEPEKEEELEEKIGTIDKDVSNEHNEPENDAEFKEKSREIDENSPEIQENLLESDYDLPVKHENNSTICILILMKKHPEICNVIDEILEFQKLFPQFRRLVEQQMGGRRLNFVYSMARGKTALEHLYDAVRCLASCIKKFIKFMDSVQEIRGVTTKPPVSLPYPTSSSRLPPPVSLPYPTSSPRQPPPAIGSYPTSSPRQPPPAIGSYPTSSPRRPPPAIGSYPVPVRNQTHQWWKNREYRWNEPVSLLTDSEEHLRVKRMDNDRYARRESPKECAASIAKIDPNVCGTLARMELVNSILKNSNDIHLQEDFFPEWELPLNLNSEDMGLGSFLDALRETFFDAETTGPDVNDEEKPRRDPDISDEREYRQGPDTGDISSAQGRRHMVKRNDEGIAEIFQTSDSRIEFMPQNDHSSFRNRPESWNANDFMDNRNKEFEARRVPGVVHRSPGVNDEKRKQRVKSLPKRLTAYGTSRRANGGSLKKTVISEKNRTSVESPQSSRSLRRKVSSRRANKEQKKRPKRLEHHRRSKRRPQYSADAVVPMKTYPYYRLGDTEKSENSTDKEQCITDNEKKKFSWKQWAFSKFNEFSKKIFGSHK